MAAEGTSREGEWWVEGDAGAKAIGPGVSAGKGRARSITPTSISLSVALSPLTPIAHFCPL